MSGKKKQNFEKKTKLVGVITKNHILKKNISVLFPIYIFTRLNYPRVSIYQSPCVYV